MSKIDYLFSDSELPPKHENIVKNNYSSLYDYLGGVNTLYSKTVQEEPYKDIMSTLPTLRRISQNLCDTNEVFRSAIQNLSNLIIGKGIFCTPLPRIADREKAKQIAGIFKDVWESWSDDCHKDGQLDLVSILNIITSSIYRDGDILVYLTNSNDKTKKKIDLLSSNRIETPTDKEILSKLGPKSNIFMGVETDNKEIVKYWVKDNVGSKNGYTPFAAKDENGDMLSVLLKNPISPDRPNSYRSLPALASCFTTIDQLRKLMDSELQGNVLKTKQYGVYKTDKPQDLSNMNVKRLSDQSSLMVIKTNEDYKTETGSDISNPNLSKTVEIYLQNISSVLNVPYTILFNIVKDSSYSAFSAQRQIAWENTERVRAYLIKNLLKPLYRTVIKFAIESKQIEGIEEWTEDLLYVEFSGRPVVPLKEKDVNIAQQLAIEIGQKSIVQVANEYGNNAYDVLDQQLEYLAYRKSKLSALGLTEQDLIPTEQQKETITENQNTK